MERYLDLVLYDQSFARDDYYIVENIFPKENVRSLEHFHIFLLLLFIIALFHEN